MQSDNHAPGRRLERTWYSTFLLESSDSLSPPSPFCIPSFSWAFSLPVELRRYHAWQHVDELRAKRAAQGGLCFFKHNFACTSLGAHNFVVASARNNEGAYSSRRVPSFEILSWRSGMLLCSWKSASHTRLIARFFRSYSYIVDVN